jgi:adenosylcobinamide amidohydrolase
VVSDYHRTDVEKHVAELARTFRLGGAGVGMLTAASVRRHERSSDEEVNVDVTVGLSHPTWAASDEPGAIDTGLPGTINLVAFVPVRLEDGALLNAIVTATEAKSQALWEANFLATGTPSDAVTILCPLEGDVARFAGPRSSWGSRLARAVHRAVFAGATRTAT